MTAKRQVARVSPVWPPSAALVTVTAPSAASVVSYSATVLVAQDGLYGDVRISDESLKSERVSADRVEWQVPVPANGKVELTATFDTRY